MIWFKSCASQVLRLRQPLEWVTPLGLPVVQPYVTEEQVDDAIALLPIRHKQVYLFFLKFFNFVFNKKNQVSL